jgi:CDP-diacylglycerol--glycerol-3-phosphate 3-phosphatidyltransferase
MNLPNKLTVLRVLLIPFFVASLLYKSGEDYRFRIIALIIFCIAAITDTLDGIIARKYNLITDFGKFMDPLADKVLVCSGLICFIELGQLSSVIVLIIIAREFIISGIRLVASDNGVVIAAAMSGKLKTVVQMITVILLIINRNVLKPVTDICIILMVILTLFSLGEYIFKNKNVILSSK